MPGATPTETERDRVTEAVTRLFVSTDERDWSAVRECFAGEVLFDISSLSGEAARQVKPEEIVAGWREGLRELQAVHHQIGNFLVVIADNEASVSCYGIALHYLPHAQGGSVRRFVGSYTFHLVRGGNDWQIDMMAYHNKFTDGNLDLGTSAE